MVISVKDLVKRYGELVALDHLDLEVREGEILGLLGPNGSGKTTLIKLANGLLTPTSGEILIDGKAPSPETKAIVSYLPDRNALPDWMTVAQTVDYYADFYADFRRDTAQEMLARLAKETGMFPVFEAEYGEVTSVSKIRQQQPVHQGTGLRLLGGLPRQRVG